MKKRIVRDRISEAFENKELITRALARGAQKALLQHKQAGNPVVVWQDGKIVWLKPEEIEIFDIPDERYFTLQRTIKKRLKKIVRRIREICARMKHNTKENYYSNLFSYDVRPTRERKHSSFFLVDCREMNSRGIFSSKEVRRLIWGLNSRFLKFILPERKIHRLKSEKEAIEFLNNFRSKVIELIAMTIKKIA